MLDSMPLFVVNRKRLWPDDERLRVRATNQEMERSPKKAGLSPERASDFDRKFQLLNEAMQKNMQLTQQYKELKSNMLRELSGGCSQGATRGEKVLALVAPDWSL